MLLDVCLLRNILHVSFWSYHPFSLLTAISPAPTVTMKFSTPSLTFLVISPVLASLAVSPVANQLMRRVDECSVFSLQFPSSLDSPCGTGYVLPGCTCCPGGQIGCALPAVCTLGTIGNYICEVPSSSGTQCTAGSKPCG
jgi:hypothetical protein